MKKKIHTLKNTPRVRKVQGKMTEVFNSKAFKVASVVKESAFCAAFVLAAATGVMAPLSAALITSSHGLALGKSIKRLLTPVRPRRVSMSFNL